MGGTAGTGTAPTQKEAQQFLASQPAGTVPNWVSGLLAQPTSPTAAPAAAPASASPLAVNPVAPATSTAAPSTGFTHAAYQPTPAALPHIGAADPVVTPTTTDPAKLTKPYDPVFKEWPMRQAGENTPEMNWQLAQNLQVRRPGDTMPEAGYSMLGQYEQRVRDYEAWYKQQAGVK